MTTLWRKTQDNSHGEAPATLEGLPSCSRHEPDTIQNRCCVAPHLYGRSASGTAKSHSAAGFLVQSTSVHIWVSRGVACVLCTGARPRARERSTDRFCATSANDNNLNKIKDRARTEMSGASAGRGFGLPIWLLWLSPPRQKRTWRSSLASMRERLADGLQIATSRQPKRSASSSAKSCGAITSAIKRRPF